MFQTVIITFSARYFDTNNVPSKILQRQTLLTCKRSKTTPFAQSLALIGEQLLWMHVGHVIVKDDDVSSISATENSASTEQAFLGHFMLYFTYPAGFSTD